MSERDIKPVKPRRRGSTRGQPRTKSSAVVTEKRIAEVELAMAECRVSPAWEEKLAKRWKVSTRQVRNYVLTVRKRWREAAEALGPDEKNARRDQMRAAIQLVFTKAMERKVAHTDVDGKTSWRTSPDLRNALIAAKLAIDLDGLAAPSKSEVEVTTISKQAPRTADQLVEFLRTGVLRAAPEAAAALPGAGKPIIDVVTGANGANGKGQVH